MPYLLIHRQNINKNSQFPPKMFPTTVEKAHLPWKSLLANMEFMDVLYSR